MQNESHVTVLLFKAAKCTACPLKQTLALVHLQSCCLLWQCMINISNPFMHRRAESKTSSGARVNRYDSFHNGITIWDWETRCLKFSTLALCTVLNSLEVNVLWPLTDILHRMYPLLCCILEQAHWVSLVKEYSSGCRIPRFLLLWRQNLMVYIHNNHPIGNMSVQASLICYETKYHVGPSWWCNLWIYHLLGNQSNLGWRQCLRLV